MATEERIGGVGLSFFDGMQSASSRVRINALSRDFLHMRNALVHEGTLVGGKFAGKSRNDAASVAADVLHWFDEFMHSAMRLGTVRRRRFTASDFNSVNSYSIE